MCRWNQRQVAVCPENGTNIPVNPSNPRLRGSKALRRISEHQEKSTVHLLIFALGILFCMQVFSSDSLDTRIDQLISSIESSGCSFIRNGKTYATKQGVAHIKKKYDYFKDDITTVDQFIKRTATKSLITGRRYQVRCGTDAPQNSADWISNRANAIGIEF